MAAGRPAAVSSSWRRNGVAPPVTVHRFFSMQSIAFVGAPDVHQHARRAAHPWHVEGPVRAGDVRHRRGHEDDVGRSDRPRLGHRAHAIVEGVVVVEDALGTSGRPGRVHHHHRGSRVDRGKRRRRAPERATARDATPRRPPRRRARRRRPAATAAATGAPRASADDRACGTPAGRRPASPRSPAGCSPPRTRGRSAGSGLSTSPHRRAASAMTAASIQLGSWNETTSPGLRPRDRKKAARRDAASHASARVTRRSPSMRRSRSGASRQARRATSASVSSRQYPAAR